MKNLYADTNTLVSFLIKRNESQSKEIDRVFQEAQDGKVRIIVIPEIILEVAFVLQSNYSADRDKIYQSLRYLVSTNHLEVKSRSLLLDALEIYSKTNIALLDIYLYLSAKNDDAEVFSFDKDLEKLKRCF